MRISPIIKIWICFLVSHTVATTLKAQTVEEWMKPPPKGMEFKNQGEYEDYMAKQLFEKSYKKQGYKRFDGPIQFTDKITVMFGQKFFGAHSFSDSLIPIFTLGLLHPDLFGGGIGVTITDLHELKFLSDDPTIKRYKFWVFRQGFANPQVFFMELTNISANEKTDLQTFLKGATLTFLKDAWIVI